MSLSRARTPALTRAPSRTLGRLTTLLLLLLCFPGWSPLAAAGEPAAPHVVQFSPQGAVKGVRQVTARFSDAMVPLGDPRPPTSPFEIECPEAGTGRWVDTRTWAYDFTRDLPGGIRCRFRLRPALTALDGRAVTAEREFAFSTGGPAIKTSVPRQGHQAIDEEQAFLLVLDTGATPESVLQHASFTVAGLAERVGAQVLTGSARAEIMRAQFPNGTTQPVLILQAKQRFPNEARVNLVWGKGIVSPQGVATEQDQVLPFQVRKPFTAQFTCERENPRAGCIPVTSMRLAFSAPVPWEQAKRIVLVGPGDRRQSPIPDKNPRVTVPAVTFTGPFPESSAFRIELPADLTDDARRPLSNAARFPLAVRTEAFPPLAKFSSRFGILERADPVLPVTLRNLEPEVKARLLRADGPKAEANSGLLRFLDRIKGTLFRIPPERAKDLLPWLHRVAAAPRDHSVFLHEDGLARAKQFTVPKPSGAKSFEVVGIPLDGPGLYIVELESARLGAALLGQPNPMFVPTAALVTNLAVHFKWGRENSLVWVTTLDQGRPVADAAVTIQDCTGTERWTGRTDRQGIARVSGLPKGWDALPRCERSSAHEQYAFTDSEAIRGLNAGLFVVAQTSDDLGFAHSSWDRGFELWRFRLPYEDYRGPLAVHTLLDRSLLRAGETVHMKHVLRKRTLNGFAPVPEAERPTRLEIQHLGSDQTYELPLQWDASGIAETTWAIPREVKLGSYQVVMRQPGERGIVWLSGTFRVEEFRLAAAKGLVRLPAEPQVNVTEVPVDVGVQYLAGGVARELPVILRAQLQPREWQNVEGFDDFVFANGPVREGTSRERQGGPEEELEGDAEPETEADGMQRDPAPAKPAIHQREQLTLDDAGTARVNISKLPRVTRPQDLLVEMEFRDPNGEARTVANRVPLWPAHRLVGIQPESWAASKERLKVWTAVVDVARRPVAGVPVVVDVFERMLYSHRKRLVGGFYAFEHVEEIRRVGELCRGTTDDKGRFLCEGKPPAGGNLILQASASDPAGNRTAAHQDVWVAGAGEWWFRAEDSDRMDVLPEQRRHEPGETARLQVRMPFREATALVTVEREGILDAFVMPLSGSAPTVEIPVKSAYAPNVFLSVLAVRGRVGGIQPTAFVDLGRPAFKLGIAEIRVGWRAHELRVSVTPDRQVYRVREKATVRVAVRTTDGGVPPRGSEVAVAAVDEGLLELMPNRSWNLLESMMQRRGYGITTATAQMQVVGKRHYGVKALPHGGGGGRQTTRELFDTLLLWKGRVPLNARGEAAIEIPLNDSLTSFRIAVVATGGTSLFGTGAATIRSTQDLMLLAGIPPLVREDDRVRTEVTIRNTTARTMDVTLTARVEGLTPQPLPQRVSLAPGVARPVEWDILIPAGRQSLRYEIAARESGGATDTIRVTQQVRPAVPVRTLQATLRQLDRPVRIPVERPKDALPGRGGVEVAASASLTAGLSGVRHWMERYPYSCLEQEVSRVVALRDEARWARLAAALPAHLDADGLLKYFPRMLQGSDVLTAYVMSVIHEAGWRLPTDVQQKMETGLRRFVEGAVVRHSALPTTDLAIRKLAALEALSRHGKAAPALLGSLTIEPNLWPTSAVLDWWTLLHRLPGVPNRPARLSEAGQIVRARLNLQGTTMGFSREESDALWWLMVSSDVNAARLILHLIEAGSWREDVPLIARGFLGRQRRGAWDLTVANAWGVLAVEKFARVFETAPVDGTTTASLATATERLDWGQTPRGGTLSFSWPVAGAELDLSHDGGGAPWIIAQAQAAIPLDTPLGSGYRISRSVRAIEQRVPGRWSRGDQLRVQLTIEAQSDMTWVVVSDPVPTGASHLGSGLGGDSVIAAQGERRAGWSWPAFEERGFEAFRAYYEFVPKGTTVVEYTIRLNQAGQFQLPSTRVEALYAPEMFGELPNALLEVLP
jgi:alpha-2-macroglobulin